MDWNPRARGPCFPCISVSPAIALLRDWPALLMLYFLRFGNGIGTDNLRLSFVDKELDTSGNNIAFYLVNGIAHASADEFYAAAKQVTPSLLESRTYKHVFLRDIRYLEDLTKHDFTTFKNMVHLDIHDLKLKTMTRKQKDAKQVQQEQTKGLSQDCVHFIEKYKRTAGQKKLICRAMQQLPCHTFMLTGFSKKTVPNIGQILDVCDHNVVNLIDQLLSRKNLGPLTNLQIQYGVHYGIFENGSLVTYMSTLTGMIGTPLKVAVSVEWIIGIDENHNASRMVEILKRHTAKRKQQSYVFTQVSSKRPAIQFWRGRLSHSDWGNVLVGIFHIYNQDYRIYEDIYANMIS